MQEAPNVQWDLREEPSPSGITRLFVAFLVVCCIWAVVIIIKVLWNTRSWPSTRRGKLIALSQALQAADANQVSTLAAKIPEASPEAGLRGLTAIKSIAFHELPAGILDRAELRFAYALSALRATATNLQYLATFLLIVTGAWTTYGLAKICIGFSVSKTVGSSVFYGAMSDIFGPICLSIVVLSILYILRWRILSLLARRERLWLQITGYLQLLVIPPH